VTLADPLLVVAAVARALDELSVRYVVGGSIASMLYGIPRATQDVDLVAELRVDHAEPLAARLRDAFYADADMIRDAVRRRASFNVVHLGTMFKADVFVARPDAWGRAEMDRGRVERVGEGADAVEIRFATPEDTVLHKLVWFRLGNELSERQWRDVLGVLSVQGAALDDAYLDRWAGDLGVADLLERARRAARVQ